MDGEGQDNEEGWRQSTGNGKRDRERDGYSERDTQMHMQSARTIALNYKPSRIGYTTCMNQEGTPGSLFLTLVSLSDMRTDRQTQTGT